MTEIFAAQALHQSGDRAGARARYQAIWSRIENDPDPMHAVALAHYMADVQDDPAAELAWDRRALDAALQCTDRDVQRHSTVMTSIESFMPSLHASLADDYARLGDLARAAEHLARARECVGALADDAYGRTVRGSIERLETALAAAGGAVSPND